MPSISFQLTLNPQDPAGHRLSAIQLYIFSGVRDKDLEVSLYLTCLERRVGYLKLLGEDSTVYLSFEGLQLEEKAVGGQELVQEGRGTPFQARQSHQKESSWPRSDPASSKDDLLKG